MAKQILCEPRTLLDGKRQETRNSMSVPMRKLSTGEPYALVAHVRFGGRGGQGGHSYPYKFGIHGLFKRHNFYSRFANCRLLLFLVSIGPSALFFYYASCSWGSARRSTARLLFLRFFEAFINMTLKLKDKYWRDLKNQKTALFNTLGQALSLLETVTFP